MSVVAHHGRHRATNSLDAMGEAAAAGRRSRGTRLTRLGGRLTHRLGRVCPNQGMVPKIQGWPPNKNTGTGGLWHDLMRRSRTREPISGSSNQLRRSSGAPSACRPTLCLLVALHRHSCPPVAAAICYSLLDSLSVHRVRATLLTTLCAAHGFLRLCPAAARAT